MSSILSTGTFSKSMLTVGSPRRLEIFKIMICNSSGKLSLQKKNNKIPDVDVHVCG